MLNKIKNIISKTDNFFYKKFGTDKSTKLLQNIKEAQNIFSHLNEIDGQNTVRFVGGCVRKALCGEKIDDIDLATLLKPEEVKERLISKGIKVIDTGISHGTVTAVINQTKFEITTLRKDISTDGRHANVEFTLDWEEYQQLNGVSEGIAFLLGGYQYNMCPDLFTQRSIENNYAINDPSDIINERLDRTYPNEMAIDYYRRTLYKEED